MFNFSSLARKNGMNLKQMAKLLKTTPDALKAFEESYRVNALEIPDEHDPFGTSARQAADMAPRSDFRSEDLDKICGRIVDELLAQTRVWEFNGKTGSEIRGLGPAVTPVTREELLQFPAESRPMLTGSLAFIDMNASTGAVLMDYYNSYLNEKKPEKKQLYYHLFRQGLDILDLDGLSYAMLGTNPNNIGYWLPAVAETAVEQGSLKIPKTTVIQVPLTLLQLTRIDYSLINDTTRRIINEYCMKVFSLDAANDYFIKTGTYSSKFDFRNAHVPAGKEVTELGEYLLFIQNQAVSMAGPTSSPSIYGVSTTNEWAVREYITDKEDNPCIYKGMPLHTEYRVFVDFDTAEVIGAAPYWDAEMMEKRFLFGANSGNLHDKHDYMIYLAQKEELYRRYDENIDAVKTAVTQLAKAVSDNGTLSGQWSVDVMQNGNDFWLIDMAIAEQSALYDCVPAEKRIPSKENWLPRIEA